MKCPSCGARNTTEADWCTQCYASFAPEAQEPATPSSEVPAAAPEGAVAASSEPSPPSSDATGQQMSASAPDIAEDVSPRTTISTAGDIRDVDGHVQWRCPTCQTWVGLEESSCGTCGAVRAGFGEPANATGGAVDVPEQTMLGTSVVVPGLGHILAGRTGSGITRLVLFLFWGIGGVWWLLSTQNGRAPGLVLVLGALILWGATLVDANAIAKGRPQEPFGVRGLLWTVVGVTGLLMLMVAFAAAGSLGS